MDAEAIKQQAQDETTLPEILTELAKSQDRDILRCIAANPNTPLEILEKLCAEFPDAIVANPIFDLLLLENPESKFVLLSLARASTTPVEKLKELADSVDRDIREAVVINNKTPANIIDDIFAKDMWIKESVAKNPHASETLLCSLAKDNNYDVLYAIAQRDYLSEKIIKILIQCDCSAKKFYPNHKPENYSWRIKKKLASNLNIKTDIINNLLEDDHHHVRAAVAEREDISEKQAMILANDTSDYVRKKLAANPHISPAVTKLLTTVNENRHRQSLEAFEKSNIATNEFKRQLGLIYDPQTPSEILNELATNANYLIRQGVAKHPNTTLETLNKFKTDENINVREKVAQSPKISVEIIEELARNSAPLVRRAIASNPQTSTTILDKLKSDRSLTVRLAVAENTNSSMNILQELLKDEALKIVESVKENLNKRSPKTTIEDKQVRT